MTVTDVVYIFIHTVIVQVLPTQAEVTEGDGFVQLGLRLVDIGSRDTLNQEVRVTFCPLAVSGEA